MLSALGPSALVPTALSQTRFITRQADEYPTFILVRVMIIYNDDDDDDEDDQMGAENGY